MSREAIHRLTPITWSDTLGTEVITLKNLAAGAVRVGAQHDFGPGMLYERYEWRLTVQFATAPVVAETIAVYLARSDGTAIDGGVGAVDAAGVVAWLTNLEDLGDLTVTSVDADHDMTVSGVVTLLSRYVSPVIHNNTADNLRNTDDSCEFTLTPIGVRSP